jgi:Bifunctional DNA primase/polymerase, N-terminal/AAA domain
MGLDSQNFDNAIALARTGWRIVPLHDVERGACSCGKPDCDRSAGKHPRLSKWGESATTDEATIRGWFAKWPTMNFGVATGPESGIWVLDVEAEGLATLETLERENGKLPATFKVRSGGGGEHVYFRWPTDGAVIPSRGVPGVAKIDTRGAGGQIVGPGSRSLKGEYSILADEPIADAPAWLLDLVVRRETPAPAAPSLQPTFDATLTRQRVERARAYLASVKPAVQGDGGSNVTLWAARVLVRGFALDRGTARQLMAEYSARCSPPWSEKEIGHKLDDAETKPFDKPLGWLLDAPRPERNAAPSAEPMKPTPSASAAAATEPERPRFKFYTDAEFAGGDFRVDFLITNVLARGEPCGIGGPMKTLKTSIAGDMALSLATGVPFLGEFRVPHPVTTAFISGESGKPALQRLRHRIYSAKGYPADYRNERLHWCFDVPSLGDLASMTEFVAMLKERGVEVAFADPFYLMAGGDADASNIFQMGALLRNVAVLFTEAGITFVILHHARKILEVGKQMELTDLSHAGFAEFIRQYVLLNRLQHYTDDGRHSLSLRIGGGHGQGGSFLLEVDEGILQEDGSGRKWDVQVTNLRDMPKATQEDRDAAKTAKRKADGAAKREKFLRDIDSEVAAGFPAITQNKLKTDYGWSHLDIKTYSESLLIDGIIELHRFEFEAGHGAKQPATGFRRPVVKTQENIPFGEQPVQPVEDAELPSVPAVPGEGGELPAEQPVELSPYKGEFTGLPVVPHPAHNRQSKPKPKKPGRRKPKAGAA